MKRTSSQKRLSFFPILVDGGDYMIRDVDFGLILKCVSNSEEWQSKGKKRLRAAAAAVGF